MKPQFRQSGFTSSLVLMVILICYLSSTKAETISAEALVAPATEMIHRKSP